MLSMSLYKGLSDPDLTLSKGATFKVSAIKKGIPKAIPPWWNLTFIPVF